MKNLIKTFGIIAFVAVLGLGLFTSCAEDPVPTDITITGITSTYEGKYAVIGLSKSISDQAVLAVGLGKTISGGTATWDLLDQDANAYSVKDGTYLVMIIIYESKAAYEADKDSEIYTGFATTALKATDNTIAFSKFTEL